MSLRRWLVVAALLVLAFVASRYGQAAGETSTKNLFTYPYSVDDLPNGLRLVTVPTDYPNMVALYIVVRAGSRDEVEPGKSGYGHLLEPLMFRSSEGYTAAPRDAVQNRAGG